MPRNRPMPEHKVSDEIMYAVAENMIVLPFGRDFHTLQIVL